MARVFGGVWVNDYDATRSIVFDPDNPKEVCFLYGELRSDFEDEKRAFEDCKCRCQTRRVRLRTKANGSKVVKSQCVSCGSPVGSELKKDQHPDSEPWDQDLKSEYDENRESRRREIYKKYFLLGKSDGSNFYQDYMNSDEWREKRDRIIRISNGICEGLGFKHQVQRLN